MPRPTDTNTSLSPSATALTLSSAVATHITATLHNDANLRPLDALVAEIRQLPADATADRYQVLLRPWLWWLTLASNNRVFQNLSTSDIVTTIFKAHGFTDFKLSLSGSHKEKGDRFIYCRPTSQNKSAPF
ncbi:hypothetical protein WP8S17C03_25040 [Metapseudomonas otitidis]|uniref:Uncharacterized protein n=1 Tax=Metapseudomonas otitidis TaxID=319939 RepID=A0A6S5RUC2_9GAMM|nr:hypothetical protein WP8S17C03_25040 [Pseudomonas otitidis]